ncbi:3-hydroxybutyrate dehydrogenase [Mycobacterium tuberculosis]|nr:3-hydroxybutyrate dehydrogenase [Mycobacterium tuberculosis]
MLTSHGFSRAAVVGAGLMGRRIAGVLASAGLDVAITDTNAEILHAAAVEAARVAGAGRGSVAAAADLAAAIPDADLVIEAVVENLASSRNSSNGWRHSRPTRCWPPTPRCCRSALSPNGSRTAAE